MSNTSPRGLHAGAVDLPHLLRVETAALHRAVEASTGLPDSIRTRGEYARMLAHTLVFHDRAMLALRDPRWAEQWPDFGIELARHDRTPQLRSDLLQLDHRADGVGEPSPLVLDSFGAALGCLYVIEGSALGGRMLATAFRDRLGDVPLAFFSGEGRAHPLPWRMTQAALRVYAATDGDTAAAVAGAISTFRAFDDAVALPAGVPA